MASFTAVNTPISAKNPGQTVKLEASIAAADEASAGTWCLIFRVYRGTTQVSPDLNIWPYDQALSLTPKTFSHTWTIPANLALGQYKAMVTVHTPGTWKWHMPIGQVPAYFDVVAEAPVAPVEPSSLVKISGDNQGGTVGQAQAAPMVVQALDAAGNPFVGATVVWSADGCSLSEASVVTDGEGKAAVTLTHPATPQTSAVVAASGSCSASFSQTAHMPLYGTHSPFPALLKPAGPGDALVVGFLPDDGNDYTLIEGASDEFDGGALNTDKWWRRYVYNNGTLDHLNDELERYKDIHVVSDGTLKLIASVNGQTYTAPTGKVYPMFDSAMIRSRTLIKYGYVEARVKFPPGVGVWPALWLLAQSGVQPPEIDIFEYVRNGISEHPNMLHCNVHGPNSTLRWADKNYNTQYHFWAAWGLSPTYFIDDWHVIGALWQPGLVTFYVDGFPTVQRRCDWKTNAGADPGLACIMANLAIGDDWPTNNWTTDVSTEDQVLEIDYIRTWQRSDQIITGTSVK